MMRSMLPSAKWAAGDTPLVEWWLTQALTHPITAENFPVTDTDVSCPPEVFASAEYPQHVAQPIPQGSSILVGSETLALGSVQ